MQHSEQRKSVRRHRAHCPSTLRLKTAKKARCICVDLKQTFSKKCFKKLYILHSLACLFVCFERALALVPTLPKPVELHKIAIEYKKKTHQLERETSTFFIKQNQKANTIRGYQWMWELCMCVWEEGGREGGRRRWRGNHLEGVYLFPPYTSAWWYTWFLFYLSKKWADQWSNTRRQFQKKKSGFLGAYQTTTYTHASEMPQQNVNLAWNAGRLKRRRGVSRRIPYILSKI